MTSQPSFQSLFALPPGKCDHCDHDWFPAENKRKCLHRHAHVTQHHTIPLETRIVDIGKHFKTDNDARIFITVYGLNFMEAAASIAERQKKPLRSILHKLGCYEEDCFLRYQQRTLQFIQERLDAQEEQDAPSPQEHPEQSLWESISAPLQARISETNYETWLSSLFVAEINHPTMVLGCPNPFFQEHLTENYTFVIQEELAKVSDLQKVEFKVAQRPQAPSPKEPTATPATPKVEVLPAEPSTPALQKLKRRAETRKALKQECTTAVHGKLVFLFKMYNDQLDLLIARENEEDRIEKQRESFERWLALKDQHPKDSTFDSTKIVNRRRLKKMLQQLERDLDEEGKPRPPNSS